MRHINTRAASEDISEQILHADHCQISPITNALIQRFNTLFPNEELLVLSLPKNDPEERIKILETAFDFLRKHRQI